MNTNSLKILIIYIFGCYFISGCTPTFDWRILQQEESKWQAIFPSKPFKKNRKIILNVNAIPATLQMEQYSSMVEEISFTVDSSEILEEKIELSKLSEILGKSLEKNFSLKNKKKLKNNIFQYEGTYSNSQKSSIKIVLMTKTVLKKNVVVRGIVFAKLKKFSEDQALFFLSSIE